MLEIEIVKAKKNYRTFDNLEIGDVFKFKSRYSLIDSILLPTNYFLVIADRRILNLTNLFHYDFDMFAREYFELTEKHLTYDEIDGFEASILKEEVDVYDAKIVIETP